MNIHEYQAKEILNRYGLKVPRGKVTSDSIEAGKIAQDIGGNVWVIKAQVHAGGRGKGGGIKLAKSPQEVKELAAKMINSRLITHQTGSQGRLIRKILIEEGCAIEKEFYLGVVIDRAKAKIAIMASAEGGVEIEEVARKTPEKIHKLFLKPDDEFPLSQALYLADEVGFQGETKQRAAQFIKGLYRVFLENDCSLVEINPLVLTKEGQVLALDAKLNFDDSSLFRHPENQGLRDINEEDPQELEAANHGLSYISLNGSIGCLVNGAGLAMATMDIIKLAGGEPANFLDIGGGVRKESVIEAFKIILADKKVKAVLINIFGGIVKCDLVAEGVLAAVKEVGLKIPLVVRLEGTNVARAREIIKNSSLKIIPATTMKDAAEKVVAVKGN